MDILYGVRPFKMHSYLIHTFADCVHHFLSCIVFRVRISYLSRAYLYNTLYYVCRKMKFYECLSCERSIKMNRKKPKIEKNIKMKQRRQIIIRIVGMSSMLGNFYKKCARAIEIDTIHNTNGFCSIIRFFILCSNCRKE